MAKFRNSLFTFVFQELSCVQVCPSSPLFLLDFGFFMCWFVKAMKRWSGYWFSVWLGGQADSSTDLNCVDMLELSLWQNKGWKKKNRNRNKRNSLLYLTVLDRFFEQKAIDIVYFEQNLLLFMVAFHNCVCLSLCLFVNINIQIVAWWNFSC